MNRFMDVLKIGLPFKGKLLILKFLTYIYFEVKLKNTQAYFLFLKGYRFFSFDIYFIY